MQVCRFADRDNRIAEVPLRTPKPLDRDGSCFLIGIAKGGSTLLNRMAHDILRETGRSPINIPGQLFKHAKVMDHIVSDLDGALEWDRVVYSGFRSIPSVLEQSATFARARKLILVRDPRDILVSLYFSHAYSHKMPDSGPGRAVWEGVRSAALATDIDAFALQHAPSVKSQLLRMSQFLGDPNTLILRYEDIIFDKRKLADAICTTIGVAIPTAALERIIARHNIIPQSEDRSAHIRNVSPGDHRNKLDHATIVAINAILQPVLSRFWPGEANATDPL